MDARDVINKVVSKVAYKDFVTKLVSTQQPQCQSSTCNLSGCTVSYKDYQYRQTVQLGKTKCNCSCTAN
jgi:hypothetical protein